MKKLLVTLTALSTLALSVPALAQPKAQTLPWDEYGCTPTMKFKKGAVYTVNYEQRLKEVFAGQHYNVDEASWVFVADKLPANAVKINGKLMELIDETTSGDKVYIAHPKKGDNTIAIAIAKSFTGSLCFNGAG